MSLNLNMRTVLMIGVALLAAAATALFARGWLNAQKAALGSANRPDPAYQVLVARDDVQAGHFVRARDLRWQVWPKGTLAPTYVLKGREKLQKFEGAVVRTGLVAGQPITQNLVVRPGEQGFLAAVLRPGMRAVSIRVNAITGISGFVFPGDHVDMVLTHTVRSLDGHTTHQVSETVLQDIRVLAVDQRIGDPMPNQRPKAEVAKTVTFEVTPKQVEKIGIIVKLGQISLSLRPVAREPKPSPKDSDAGKSGTVARAVPKDAGSAGSRPGAVAEATPRHKSGSGLAPIATAEAAEPSANLAEADTGRPERLFDAPASKPARAAVPPPNPVPPSQRAGITFDTQVSRALVWGHSEQGRTVHVMHGAKTEVEKF